MRLSLILPWPPSVNTYYRHVGPRVLISKKGREYRKKVEVLALETRGTVPTLKGRIEIWIIACPPDRREKRDLDNFLKAPLDAMESAGYYQDDSQIDRLTIERGPVSKGGALAITIEELPSG